MSWKSGKPTAKSAVIPSTFEVICQPFLGGVQVELKRLLRDEFLCLRVQLLARRIILGGECLVEQGRQASGWSTGRRWCRRT